MNDEVILLKFGTSGDDVDHTFAGEPQEEGMMQQSSNFPWLQNQGCQIQ